MHVAPLLPGHQRQLGHPLPLACRAALTGDNPHRRTVLPDADRIAEGASRTTDASGVTETWFCR
ncbi:hypothetical protein [Klebsiella pneumoniae]|uniref:hypothetical protein n=1 Tax=Klebsiella pneumoniae TaxID=573 RepID=UPI00187BB854